jgi:hypothetical protein
MLVGSGLRKREIVTMKKIIPSLAILAAAILLTLPGSAAAQSQSARAEYSKAKQVQRGSSYQYVDTSCHTYGGYGWGPYFGPCPYRGQVYGPPEILNPRPVFGPFMPFGPYW